MFTKTVVTADTRYNTPKEEPKASPKSVDNVIKQTEIYRRAKLVILQGQNEKSDSYDVAKDVILKAQQKQVAYGIDKYPEPLNPNTWDVIETLDHAIDEGIDKLHYLVMLHIKMQQILVGENDADSNRTWDIIDKVAGMMYSAVDELYSMAMMRVEFSRESFKNNDAFDAMAYSLKNTKWEMSILTKPTPGYVGYNIADIEATKQFHDSIEKTKVGNVSPAVERFKESIGKLSANLGTFGVNLGISGTVMDGDTLQVFSDEELEKLADKEGGR